MFPDSLVAGLRFIAVRALGDEDEAEDAVQETLARAIEAVRDRRIPTGVPLGAFVHGISRHVITDMLRRRVRESHGPELECVAAVVPSPLDAVVRDEERARVQRALARLPRRDRDLLRRCFVDGERLIDIARQLGEPVARIRKRKSRALARLRTAMQDTPSRHVSADDATVVV